MEEILKSLSMKTSKRTSVTSSRPQSPRASFDAKGQWISVSRKVSGHADAGPPSSDSLEVAKREDSVISAWRTVSEIESILGSEYKPAEEPQTAPTGLDDHALQALNSQVEAALHVSLSFKDRIEESSKVFTWSKSHRGSQRTTEEDFCIAGAHDPPALAAQVATPKLQGSPTTGSPTAATLSSPRAAAPAPTQQAPAAAEPRKPPGLCLQVPGASAPAAAAAAAAGGGPGKKPLGLNIGLQLEVGSHLPQGEWATNGVWKASDPHENLIPPHLQKIHADDLIKVRELGRGCFGSVWLVKWRGVEVAVKEMLQASNDGSAAEVFNEAEKIASLRHPCVVAFYGIVVQPGSYATVLEYVRHGSLRSKLSKFKKQVLPADIDPRRLCASIALQAARGMEYLHCQNMVHFDLKCDNLLCDLRDLLRPVVKIGDLGLSKRKRESFISGNMRGTLPWMAPELFPSMGMGSMAASMNHQDKVNEKVDVFSFGVVLWEIWTLGDQPYPSLSLQEIFAGVMTGNLRPAMPAGCEPEWAELMQDCWQGKPTLRPSFGDIARRLEALVAQWSAS